MTQCKIRQVGKRRDGSPKYWCIQHKASATGKYGAKLQRCERSSIKPIKASERLTIDQKEYKGGLALWGAVQPIFDSTRLEPDRGIHVHARRLENGEKSIDKTYREVSLISNDLFYRTTAIQEEDAINFMVCSVFGLQVTEVLCSHCGNSHLDKDVLAVNPHRKHLCAHCGRDFFDQEPSIGNPIAKLHEQTGLSAKTNTDGETGRALELKQEQLEGGIQIWGANRAVYWTVNHPKERGIHIHSYDARGNIVHDDTYDSVKIDGLALDPLQVQYFMAQNALPHLSGAVLPLSCPSCETLHFDTGKFAYTPHRSHKCKSCGCNFVSPFRKKRCIGNPIVSTLEKLKSRSPLPVKSHKSNLNREGSAGMFAKK